MPYDAVKLLFILNLHFQHKSLTNRKFFRKADVISFEITGKVKEIFKCDYDVIFHRNIEGKRIIQILVRRAYEKSSYASPRNQLETVVIKSLLSVLVWLAFVLPIRFSFKYYNSLSIKILSVSHLYYVYLLGYLFH